MYIRDAFHIGMVLLSDSGRRGMKLNTTIYPKKLSQKLGNFINLQWTLATRHQQYMDLLSLAQKYKVYIYVTVNGQTYKPSCAVVMAEN